MEATRLATQAAKNSEKQSGPKWMPSPHHSSGRNGQKVKWLIIHGTAGGASAENVGSWFQDPKAKASAHYIVGRDGQFVQSVDESNAAWANGRIETGADSWWSTTGKPNNETISIELVKTKEDNSDTITSVQKTATFSLVEDIIKRHPGILKNSATAEGGITGHFSISPQTRKRCPGPFPFDELFEYLKK